MLFLACLLLVYADVLDITLDDVGHKIASPETLGLHQEHSVIGINVETISWKGSRFLLVLSGPVGREIDGGPNETNVAVHIQQAVPNPLTKPIASAGDPWSKAYRIGTSDLPINASCTVKMCASSTDAPSRRILWATIGVINDDLVVAIRTLACFHFYKLSRQSYDPNVAPIFVQITSGAAKSPRPLPSPRCYSTNLHDAGYNLLRKPGGIYDPFSRMRLIDNFLVAFSPDDRTVIQLSFLHFIGDNVFEKQVQPLSGTGQGSTITLDLVVHSGCQNASAKSCATVVVCGVLGLTHFFNWDGANSTVEWEKLALGEPPYTDQNAVGVGGNRMCIFKDPNSMLIASHGRRAVYTISRVPMDRSIRTLPRPWYLSEVLKLENYFQHVTNQLSPFALSRGIIPSVKSISYIKRTVEVTNTEEWLIVGAPNDDTFTQESTVIAFSRGSSSPNWELRRVFRRTTTLIVSSFENRLPRSGFGAATTLFINSEGAPQMIVSSPFCSLIGIDNYKKTETCQIQSILLVCPQANMYGNACREACPSRPALSNCDGLCILRDEGSRLCPTVCGSGQYLARSRLVNGFTLYDQIGCTNALGSVLPQYCTLDFTNTPGQCAMAHLQALTTACPGCNLNSSDCLEGRACICHHSPYFEGQAESLNILPLSTCVTPAALGSQPVYSPASKFHHEFNLPNSRYWTWDPKVSTDYPITIGDVVASSRRFLFFSYEQDLYGNNGVLVYDAQMKALAFTIVLGPNKVSAMSWKEDDQLLAVTSRNGELGIFERTRHANSTVYRWKTKYNLPYLSQPAENDFIEFPTALSWLGDDLLVGTRTRQHSYLRYLKGQGEGFALYSNDREANSSYILGMSRAEPFLLVQTPKRLMVCEKVAGLDWETNFLSNPFCKPLLYGEGFTCAKINKLGSKFWIVATQMWNGTATTLNASSQVYMWYFEVSRWVPYKLPELGQMAAVGLESCDMNDGFMIIGNPAADIRTVQNIRTIENVRYSFCSRFKQGEAACLSPEAQKKRISGKFNAGQPQDGAFNQVSLSTDWTINLAANTKKTEFNNTGLVYLYQYNYETLEWKQVASYAGALNQTRMQANLFDYTLKFGGSVSLSGNFAFMGVVESPGFSDSRVTGSFQSVDLRCFQSDPKFDKKSCYGFRCPRLPTGECNCSHCFYKEDCHSDGKCICPPGFELDNHAKCIDVDECANAKVCGNLDKCTNYIGGFNCSCFDGRILLGDQCVWLNNKTIVMDTTADVGAGDIISRFALAKNGNRIAVLTSKGKLILYRISSPTTNGAQFAPGLYEPAWSHTKIWSLTMTNDPFFKSWDNEKSPALEISKDGTQLVLCLPYYNSTSCRIYYWDATSVGFYNVSTQTVDGVINPVIIMANDFVLLGWGNTWNSRRRGTAGRLDEQRFFHCGFAGCLILPAKTFCSVGGPEEGTILCYFSDREQYMAYTRTGNLTNPFIVQSLNFLPAPGTTFLPHAPLLNCERVNAASMTSCDYFIWATRPGGYYGTLILVYDTTGSHVSGVGAFPKSIQSGTSLGIGGLNKSIVHPVVSTSSDSGGVNKQQSLVTVYQRKPFRPKTPLSYTPVTVLELPSGSLQLSSLSASLQPPEWHSPQLRIGTITVGPGLKVLEYDWLFWYPGNGTQIHHRGLGCFAENIHPQSCDAVPICYFIGSSQCDAISTDCWDGGSLTTFRCNCKSGFERVGDYKCSDIDECLGAHNCTLPGQYCANQLGGYTCPCKSGYTQNNDGTCTDIDECAVSPLICQWNSTMPPNTVPSRCVNKQGGYECACPANQIVQRNTTACEGMDVCNDNRLPRPPCTETCITTGPNQYKCACDQPGELEDEHTCKCGAGYDQSYDIFGRRLCSDIDECQRGTHNCSHECKNTNGSYNCSCFVGFDIGPSDFECTPVPCQFFEWSHWSLVCDYCGQFRSRSREIDQKLSKGSPLCFPPHAIVNNTESCDYPCKTFISPSWEVINWLRNSWMHISEFEEEGGFWLDRFMPGNWKVDPEKNISIIGATGLMIHLVPRVNSTKRQTCPGLDEPWGFVNNFTYTLLGDVNPARISIGPVSGPDGCAISINVRNPVATLVISIGVGAALLVLAVLLISAVIYWCMRNKIDTSSLPSDVRYFYDKCLSGVEGWSTAGTPGAASYKYKEIPLDSSDGKFIKNMVKKLNGDMFQIRKATAVMNESLL